MPVSHQRVRALLEQALDLGTTAERESLLAACPDPELAADVRAMLGLQAEAARLDRSALHFAQLDEPPLPARIGPFRIVGLLGRGGMGAVYHGVRDDGSFRMDVAIKVVRDLHSPEQLMRFERERALLARLDHPGIARVLDGGRTDDGQPWMAIERVLGQSLDQYVAERRPSVRERVRLIEAISDAVQYAHQNLIVHRDLKPANVLVQADGRPRLLDFGVAKLIGEDDHTQTAGGAPMTFAYAAPEQIRGEAITTATDVYALGVILYELLTGERPHLASGGNPLGLLQAITDTDATAPSVGLRRRATTTGGGIDPRAAHELEGDLDTIVLKALSRDPARRYHSARAFADDLGRWLAHRPIQARPDSPLYRLSKWLRRNRALAATLVLLAGTAATAGAITWHLSRQNQQRTEQALRSARAAESLQRVLTGMFQEADLARQDRSELTVGTLLGLAQARAERDLRGDDDLYLSVSSELANGVFRVVDRERGADLHRALFERLQAAGQVSADTRVLVLTHYYDALATLGDMRAVAEIGALLETAMQEIPPGSERWAWARQSLLSQMNDNVVQERGFRELLDHPALATNPSLRRWTRLLLANVMRLNDQVPQAQALLERELVQARQDGTPMEQAQVLDRLARIQRGDARTASMREVDALTRAQLGADHPLAQQKRYTLLLNLLGTDSDPALDAEIEALLDARRPGGGIQYFSMLSNYLGELNVRRQYTQARRYAAESLRLRDQVGLDRDHPFYGSAVAEGFAARAAAGESGLEAELDAFVASEAQSYFRAMALSAKATLQLARRDCAAVAQTLSVFEATGDPASRLMMSRFLRGECALIEGEAERARAAFEELVSADAADPHLGRMIGARGQIRLAALIANRDPQRAQTLHAEGLRRISRYLEADDHWWQELGIEPPRPLATAINEASGAAGAGARRASDRP